MIGIGKFLVALGEETFGPVGGRVGRPCQSAETRRSLVPIQSALSKAPVCTIAKLLSTKSRKCVCRPSKAKADQVPVEHERDKKDQAKNIE